MVFSRLIQVQVNNICRKHEYGNKDLQYQVGLDTVLKHFDIQGDICGVSHNGSTKYDVYCLGKPTVSPVDLSHIITDPLAKDLIAFKIDLKDNSIRTKIYHIGNIFKIPFDKPIAGTGVYVGEDTFTVYYPTDYEVPTTNYYDLMTRQGFSATTFYSDGTTSDESIYTNTTKGSDTDAIN
jgi:hypothetical protein